MTPKGTETWFDRLAASPTVFDACMPHPLWEIRRRRNQGEKRITQDVLYPLLRKGGVGGGIASVFSAIKRMQPIGLPDALRNLGMMLEDLEQSVSTFRIVRNASDFHLAAQNGQVALLLGFQGLPPIEQELYYIGMFKQLGVRVIQATYNEKCEVGDGCAERNDGGLSNFGAKVVSEVNARRMVLDLSHVGERTFFDVLEASTAPVLASHSNARALCDHFRCLTDAQIRAVGAKGGVVGINSFAPHVAPQNPNLTHFLNHIDHMVKLIGAEHVGIGLDLIHYTAPVEKYPDLYVPTGEAIEGLEDQTRIPAIAEGLVARGYSDPEILGILGGNFVRVIKQILDD